MPRVSIMEPITTVSAFASIISLIGVFKSERRAKDSATINQYVDWLRRCQHDQLANLIQGNIQLSQSLQTLLSQQHDEVMAKLRGLDQMLSDVASRTAIFKEIAGALPLSSRISDQAVSILRELNEANASQFAEIPSFDGTCFQISDGKRGNIVITDERFIEDDLLTLCELGLLRLRQTSKGTRFFHITRAGAEVGG
jgi:hypothetical protein